MSWAGAYLEGAEPAPPPLNSANIRPNAAVHWYESLKLGQLTLVKMIKIVGTRCQIYKMYQIQFQLGLRPRRGSLQRSPRPPSWIKGTYF